MARKSTRTFRMYTRLLRRDIRRNVRRLIRVKRARGQFILTFTRPSFKTSRRYYVQLRKARKAEAPLRRNVAAAYLLLIVGIGSMSLALIRLNSMQPTTDRVVAIAAIKAPVSVEPGGMKKSLPVRLSIPDIAVDTSLIQLGKNSDGTMQTPESYDVAGWYQYSPTPGEIGPAVLTGHVDNYKGAAVFFRLKDLQPGQKISVTREDGSVATFAVTKLEQFDQDRFPTNDVYGNTKDPQLRLITCGGPFNHLTGEYTQNTVVYATYVTPD